MTAERRSRTHWTLLAGALAAPAALVALRLATEPDARGHGTHEQLGLPPCLAMRWLEVPCPTCGVTTAASHVAHGAPREAFLAQPFGAVLALVVPVAAVLAVAAHLRGRDLGAWIEGPSGRRLAFSLVAGATVGWAWTLARALVG